MSIEKNGPYCVQFLVLPDSSTGLKLRSSLNLNFPNGTQYRGVGYINVPDSSEPGELSLYLLGGVTSIKLWVIGVSNKNNNDDYTWAGNF